jgi:hypothetical protein
LNAASLLFLDHNHLVSSRSLRLGDLGIYSRSLKDSLKDLDVCGRALRLSFTGAEDAADAAGNHCDRAADVISTVLEASK